MFDITPAGVGETDALMLLAGNALGIENESIAVAVAVVRRLVVYSTVTVVTLASSPGLLAIWLSRS